MTTPATYTLVRSKTGYLKLVDDHCENGAIVTALDDDEREMGIGFLYSFIGASNVGNDRSELSMSQALTNHAHLVAAQMGLDCKQYKVVLRGKCATLGDNKPTEVRRPTWLDTAKKPEATA